MKHKSEPFYSTDHKNTRVKKNLRADNVQYMCGNCLSPAKTPKAVERGSQTLERKPDRIVEMWAFYIMLANITMKVKDKFSVNRHFLQMAH